MHTTERALMVKDKSLRNDMRAMQPLTRKATGGHFRIERKMKEACARLEQTHVIPHVGKYITPGVAMADRVVCRMPSTEVAGSDGEEVTAGSESEVSESVGWRC